MLNWIILYQLSNSATRLKISCSNYQMAKGKQQGSAGAKKGKGGGDG
jgi:hypothetical protein